MEKPWPNKFNFLALLSKDSKYQELLQEISQLFLSKVSHFCSAGMMSSFYFSSILSISAPASTILIGHTGHGPMHGCQRNSTWGVKSLCGSGCRVTHMLIFKRREMTSLLMASHLPLDAFFRIWRPCSSLMSFIPLSMLPTAKSVLLSLEQSFIQHLRILFKL